MRRGRCVGKSYHNFDCFINVTHNVRSLCAGKRRCKFEVLSELGAKYDPCTELESFLDVDYDCLNGWSMTSRPTIFDPFLIHYTLYDKYEIFEVFILIISIFDDISSFLLI